MAQINRTLEMTFSNTLNKNHIIRVYDAKSDMTEAEITAVMDNIIAKNIFSGAGGELIGKVGAKLTSTQVDDFQLA